MIRRLNANDEDDDDGYINAYMRVSECECVGTCMRVLVFVFFVINGIQFGKKMGEANFPPYSTELTNQNSSAAQMGKMQT